MADNRDRDAETTGAGTDEQLRGRATDEDVLEDVTEDQDENAEDDDEDDGDDLI